MTNPTTSKKSALVAALLAGAVTTTLILAVSPTSQAQQAPAKAKKPRLALKVGVVDVGALFKSYKRKDAFEKKINDQRAAHERYLKKELEKVKAMRIRFGKTILRRGSDAWLKQRDDLRIAEYGWERLRERLAGILKGKVERETLKLLAEIRAAIRKWAGDKHYDLILKVDSSDPEDPKGDLGTHFREQIFRNQIADVLHHDETALDVTRYVKIKLNSRAWLKRMEVLDRKKR